MDLGHYASYVNPAWATVLRQLDLDAPVIRATGTRLETAAGRTMLDMVAGFGAAVLGHNPPEIAALLQESLAGKRVNLNPWGYSPDAGPLAAVLLELAGHDLAKVHFATTGAEAVESAVKFAMVATGRRRVLCVRNGFHGLTLWATHAAGHEQWRHGLGAAAGEVDFVDLDAADAAIEMLRSRDYALFLAEPLQGSSGNAAWLGNALAEVALAARQNGTLVAFDEAMTGLGRTGAWFAFQRILPHASPDLLIVSKGLTGGLLPVSAVLMTEHVYGAMFGGPGRAKSHGSTFSGYHLGLSVARATVDALTALEIPRQVREREAYLGTGLARLACKHRQLAEVRGAGLAWALGMADHAGPSAELAAALCVELIDRNILVSVAANEPHWLRLTPPLNISTAELDTFLDGLDLSLQACES